MCQASPQVISYQMIPVKDIITGLKRLMDDLRNEYETLQARAPIDLVITDAARYIGLSESSLVAVFRPDELSSIGIDPELPDCPSLCCQRCRIEEGTKLYENKHGKQLLCDDCAILERLDFALDR